MLDVALLVLPIIAAMAAGWFLGRFQSRGFKASHRPPSHDYYRGLGSLIDNKADDAVESFIKALEINTDTIPAYLALADLFRRKGDYDRAIEMHQTLLARSDLLHEDFIRIQLSLAKDYNAVGLFERAEALLQSVITENPRDEQRHLARRQLAKLYESQKEWELALKTAMKLPDSKRGDIAHEMANYACELALSSLENNDSDVEHWLKQALRLDPTCVRANLMWAHHRIKKHAWRGAVKHLKEVSDQDAKMIPETLPLLSKCFSEMGNSDAYGNYLDQCLRVSPSTSLWMERAHLIEKESGIPAASEYMVNALRKHPSLKGFDYLIDLKLQESTQEERDRLKILKELTGQLVQSKPKYQCQQCGYESKQLYWQCPSCKTWDSTRLIQGLEGE